MHYQSGKAFYLLEKETKNHKESMAVVNACHRPLEVCWAVLKTPTVTGRQRPVSMLNGKALNKIVDGTQCVKEVTGSCLESVSLISHYKVTV